MRSGKGRVLVAMSGGVDSSVSAALLLRRGFEVTGVTLALGEGAGTESGCLGGASAQAAARAASHLGIPHEVLPAREAFGDRVLAWAWDEYARGRTPNPCVVCNERIKFELLLGRAREVGADKIATGHYARFRREGEAGPQLRRGVDADKDQSYFLFRLTDEQLDSALAPVGECTKGEVRQLAGELGLPNAGRAESQDACFHAPNERFAETLRRRRGAPAKPGKLIDPQGRVLGSHEGIHLFTVGQRRGLGVALGTPAFVLEIRPESGEVVLGTEEEALFARTVAVSDVRWFGDPPAVPRELTVKIRYRHPGARAWVEAAGDGAVVRFEAPQRAVTPGQASVFYEGDAVFGGGWIEKAF